MHWLSYELDPADPRPPAIPAPVLRPLYRIASDGARVHLLELANHTGTHCDAPAHVIEDGLVIGDFAPAELVYHAVALIDLPLADAAIATPEDLSPLLPQLVDADLVLVRFDRGRQRRDDPDGYACRCPGFGAPAMRLLRERCPRLRAVGVDTPSIACIAHLATTMVAHHALLEGQGRRFLILEDLRLDADLPPLARVEVQPWRVRGWDSGPCTVVGYER